MKHYAKKEKGKNLTYMLTLIEGFWYLSREDGIYGAYYDEYDWVEESDGVRRVYVRIAYKHVVFACWVVVDSTSWRNYLPYHHYYHLEHTYRNGFYMNPTKSVKI